MANVCARTTRITIDDMGRIQEVTCERERMLRDARPVPPTPLQTQPPELLSLGADLFTYGWAPPGLHGHFYVGPGASTVSQHSRGKDTPGLVR